MVILLLVYRLLLEQDKMHLFNRYFLVFGLIFSLVIPLLAIDISLFTLSGHQLAYYIREIQSRTNAGNPTGRFPENVVATNGGFEIDFYTLLIGLYVAVLLMLIARFLWNLYTLTSRIRRNVRVASDNVTFVLLDYCSPHNFFQFIFIEKNAYLKGAIDNAVLEHERVHARQWHSLDILFVEVLKIVFWFNPAIYFYKKAIQLNHEFLADEAVLANTQDITSYQKLLLQMKTGRENLLLASSMHYSITKKRFIMMTKKSNRLRTLCKQLVTIPLLTGLLFLFGTTNTRAQNVEKMSITELIRAAYGKMESLESLPATEKQELIKILAKMQDELREKNPPQPPTAISQNQKVPEEDITKQERIDLDKLFNQLRQKMQAYNKVTPDSSHIEKLKATYSEMMNAFNNFVERQKEIYGEDAPPPPPIYREPSWRIHNNK